MAEHRTWEDALVALLLMARQAPAAHSLLSISVGQRAGREAYYAELRFGYTLGDEVESTKDPAEIEAARVRSIVAEWSRVRDSAAAEVANAQAETKEIPRIHPAEVTGERS